MGATEDLRNAVACSFTVEHRKGVGGDFERNEAGSMDERRVTFNGWVTDELYNAIIESIKEVLSDSD